MEDKKYNGWTNYETWLVNLHLLNDQCTIEQIEEITKNSKSIYDLHVSMKDYCEELLQHDGKNLFLADMLNAALSEVDWQELSQHYWDDFKEEEEEESAETSNN